MEDRREVCLEEEVEKLRRMGFGEAEISAELGLDRAWVAQVLEMSPDEEPAGGEQRP